VQKKYAEKFLTTREMMDGQDITVVNIMKLKVGELKALQTKIAVRYCLVIVEVSPLI
jgi:hypothetical protein